MITLRIETRVRATQQATFDAFADHEALSDVPGLTCVLEEVGSPDRNGLGALRRVGGPGVAARERITSFDRPHSYTYKVEGGVPLKHDGGRLEFHADGDHTRVVWTTTVGSGLPAIGSLVDRAIVGPFLTRALGQLARSAKRRAERGS